MWLYLRSKCLSILWGHSGILQLSFEVLSIEWVSAGHETAGPSLSGVDTFRVKVRLLGLYQDLGQKELKTTLLIKFDTGYLVLFQFGYNRSVLKRSCSVKNG